ncbi:unnamed protein product [Paramecium sonneborni]|uniref:Uncharacterized protein n=1 Tax=Paramecium sonneborni TaxID=65129 RepID=A0A8S1RKK6_9CILI|nr:unnamed protein product [Paramecium sonneborni]CAD8127276.1 unnamed protein product [Paramecium sonneborni]
MNSKALRNLQGYLETERKCRERFPMIDECQSFWNHYIDVKECQHQLKMFEECFSKYKPAAYQHKGREPDKD